MSNILRIINFNLSNLLDIGIILKLSMSNRNSFQFCRKLIFSLQFIFGDRGRVQVSHRKAIPWFRLDLQISEKGRGACLRKRTQSLQSKM